MYDYCLKYYIFIAGLIYIAVTIFFFQCTHFCFLKLHFTTLVFIFFSTANAFFAVAFVLRRTLDSPPRYSMTTAALKTFKQHIDIRGGLRRSYYCLRLLQWWPLSMTLWAPFEITSYEHGTPRRLAVVWRRKHDMWRTAKTPSWQGLFVTSMPLPATMNLIHLPPTAINDPMQQCQMQLFAELKCT